MALQDKFGTTGFNQEENKLKPLTLGKPIGPTTIDTSDTYMDPNQNASSVPKEQRKPTLKDKLLSTKSPEQVAAEAQQQQQQEQQDYLNQTPVMKDDKTIGLFGDKSDGDSSTGFNLLKTLQGKDSEGLNKGTREAGKGKGYSYNAWEVPHGDPKKMDPATRKRVDSHRWKIAELTGLPLSEITDEDVYRKGRAAAAEAKRFMAEGGNKEAHFKTDGKKGKYGRKLGRLFNPVTGKYLDEHMNTPEWNADFYDKWNQKGFDERQNPENKTSTEVGEVVSNQESDTALGTLNNMAQSALDTLNEAGTNAAVTLQEIGVGVTNLYDRATTDGKVGYEPFNQYKQKSFETVAKAEAEIDSTIARKQQINESTILRNTDIAVNAAKAKGEISTPEEIKAFREQTLKTVAEQFPFDPVREKAVQMKSTFDEDALAYYGTEDYKARKYAAQQVADNVNAQNELFGGDADDIAKVDPITNRVTQVDHTNRRQAAEFQKGNNEAWKQWEDGNKLDAVSSAIWNGVANPGEVAKTATKSLAYMGTLMTGAGTANALNTTYRNIKDDWNKAHPNEVMTSGQLATRAAAATLITFIQKGQADIVLGSGGKKVAERIAQGFGEGVTAAIVQKAVRTAISAGSEPTTEMIEEIITGLSTKDKVDPKQTFIAGTSTVMSGLHQTAQVGAVRGAIGAGKLANNMRNREGDFKNIKNDDILLNEAAGGGTGSLSGLIKRGESTSKYVNNADNYNYGKAGDAAKEMKSGNIKYKPTEMTIAEIQNSPLFAVGSYQIIPSTLKEGVKALGLKPDTKFTEDVQRDIYANYLLKEKRKSVYDYITGGKLNKNLVGAAQAMALEWAAIGSSKNGSYGKGLKRKKYRAGESVYGGIGNNSASIKPEEIQLALKTAKATYQRLIKDGLSKQEAWETAIQSEGVNYATQEIKNQIDGVEPQQAVPSEYDQDTVGSVAEQQQLHENPVVNGYYNKHGVDNTDVTKDSYGDNHIITKAPTMFGSSVKELQNEIDELITTDPGNYSANEANTPQAIKQTYGAGLQKAITDVTQDVLAEATAAMKDKQNNVPGAEAKFEKARESVLALKSVQANIDQIMQETGVAQDTQTTPAETTDNQAKTASSKQTDTKAANDTVAQNKQAPVSKTEPETASTESPESIRAKATKAQEVKDTPVTIKKRKVEHAKKYGLDETDLVKDESGEVKYGKKHPVTYARESYSTPKRMENTFRDELIKASNLYQKLNNGERPDTQSLIGHVYGEMQKDIDNAKLSVMDIKGSRGASLTQRAGVLKLGKRLGESQNFLDSVATDVFAKAEAAANTVNSKNNKNSANTETTANESNTVPEQDIPANLEDDVKESGFGSGPINRNSKQAENIPQAVRDAYNKAAKVYKSISKIPKAERTLKQDKYLENTIKKGKDLVKKYPGLKGNKQSAPKLDAERMKKLADEFKAKMGMPADSSDTAEAPNNNNNNGDKDAVGNTVLKKPTDGSSGLQAKPINTGDNKETVYDKAKHFLQRKFKANGDQRALINKLESFLDNPKKSRFYIQGRGGTGKTTTVSQGVKNYKKSANNPRNNVVLTTVSYKALGVLQGMAKDINGRSLVTASALITNSKDVPVAHYKALLDDAKRTILIVDEMSMLTLSELKKIDDYVEAGGKVIYMGDYHQVMAIEPKENGPGSENKLSKVFDPFFNKVPEDSEIFELTEIMRQEEGSDILSLANYYADSIDLKLGIINTLPNPDPVFEALEKAKEGKESDIRTVDNATATAEFIEKYKQYQEGKLEEPPIFIAYTNRSVANFNDTVRNKIIDNPNNKEYVVGETLLAYANGKDKEDTPRIYNSATYKIVAISEPRTAKVKTGADGTKARGLTFTPHEGVKEITLTLEDANGDTYKMTTYEGLLEETIKEFKRSKGNFETVMTRMLLSKFGSLTKSDYYNHYSNEIQRSLSAQARTDLFANGLESLMSYPFAMTAHKSQGSTYKDVYIEPVPASETNDETNHLNYTMVTRASEQVNIVTNKGNEGIVDSFSTGLVGYAPAKVKLVERKAKKQEPVQEQEQESIQEQESAQTELPGMAPETEAETETKEEVQESNEPTEVVTETVDTETEAEVENTDPIPETTAIEADKVNDEIIAFKESLDDTANKDAEVLNSKEGITESNIKSLDTRFKKVIKLLKSQQEILKGNVKAIAKTTLDTAEEKYAAYKKALENIDKNSPEDLKSLWASHTRAIQAGINALVTSDKAKILTSLSLNTIKNSSILRPNNEEMYIPKKGIFESASLKDTYADWLYDEDTSKTTGDLILEKLVGHSDISPEEKKLLKSTLDRLETRIKNFTQITGDNKQGKKLSPYLVSDNPIYYFTQRDENGNASNQLHPAVIRAMTLAAYTGAFGKMSNTRYPHTTETLQSVVPVISPYSKAAAELKGVGNSFTEMSKDMGSDAMDLLGLNFRDTERVRLNDQMIRGLGGTIIKSLSSDFNGKDEKPLFRQHSILMNEETKESIRTVSLNTELFNIKDKESASNVYYEKQQKNLGKIAEVAYPETAASRVRGYSTKPITKLSENDKVINNTDGLSRISTEQEKIILEGGKIKWSTPKSKQKLLNDFGKEDMAYILGEVSEDRISELNPMLADSIQGRNSNLRQGLDGLYGALEKGDLDKGVYFKYRAVRNERIDIDSNVLNYIANKAQRMFIAPDNWTNTLDISDKKDLEGFKYALEELGLEYDEYFTDKGNFKRADSNVKQVVKLLQKQQIEPDFKLSKADKELLRVTLEELNGKESERAHGLAAMYALAEMMNRPKGSTTFETNLMMEIDGKTNGVMLALYQFVSDMDNADKVREYLEAGALYTENSKYKNVGEWKADGNLDNYQRFSTHIDPAIEKLPDDRKAYANEAMRIFGLDGDNSTPAKLRNWSKSFVMQGAYLAGAISLIQDKITGQDGFKSELSQVTQRAIDAIDSNDNDAYSVALAEIGTMLQSNIQPKRLITREDGSTKLVNNGSPLSVILRQKFPNMSKGKKGMRETLMNPRFYDVVADHTVKVLQTALIDVLEEDVLENSVIGVVRRNGHLTASVASGINLLFQYLLDDQIEIEKEKMITEAVASLKNPKELDIARINNHIKETGLAEAETRALEVLQNKGLLPSVDHPLSDANDVRTRYLYVSPKPIVTDTQKVVIKNNTYTKTNVLTHTIDAKNDTVSSQIVAQDANQLANVQNSYLDGETKAKIVVASSHAQDSAINTPSLGKGIGNLNDAQASGIKEGIQNSVETNKRMHEVMTNYSVMSNLLDTVDPFLDYYNSLDLDAQERISMILQEHSKEEKVTFPGAVAALRNANIGNQNFRESKDGNIVSYNNYAHPDAAYVRNTDITNELDSNVDTETDEEFDQLFDGVAEQIQTLQTVIEQSATLANLSKDIDSPAHIKQLQQVVVSDIMPIVHKSNVTYSEVSTDNDTSSGKANTRRSKNRNTFDSRVRVKVARGRNVGRSPAEVMSPLEVYVHEHTHIALEYARHYGGRTLKGLKDTYQEVLDTVHNMDNPHELFLDKDENGNPIYYGNKDAEIAYAKEQFNYLFGNHSNAMDEFYARARSNAKLRKILEGIQVSNKGLQDINPGDSLFKKIAKQLKNLYIRIRHNLYSKNTKHSAKKAIDEYARAINKVENRTKEHTKYTQTISAMNNVLYRGSQKLIFSPLYKGTKFTLNKTRDSNGRFAKATHAAAVGLMSIYHADDTSTAWRSFVSAQQKLSKRASAFNTVREGLIGSLSHTILNNAGELGKKIETFQRKQKALVEGRYESEYIETYKQIQEAFSEGKEFTDEKWEALTDAAVRTHLFDLTNIYSTQEVNRMLKDTSYRSKQYRTLLDRLGNKTGLSRQINDLGYFMANGQVRHIKSATNYNNIDISHSTLPEDEAIGVLKALRTITAIENTNPTAIKTLAGTLDTELARKDLADEPNGVERMLGAHQAAWNQSKEERFDGNSTQMLDGYVAAEIPDYIDIKMSFTDEQTVKDMANLGYKLVTNADLGEQLPGVKDSFNKIYAASKNPITKTRNTAQFVPTGIYVNDTYAKPKRQSGALNVTVETHQGTSLKDIVNNTSKDIDNRLKGQTRDALIKRLMREIEAAEARGDFDYKEGQPRVPRPVPLRNSQGLIVDYRFMMDKETKANALKFTQPAHKTIGRMTGKAVIDINKQKVNKEIIKALQEDYGDSIIERPDSEQEYLLVRDYKQMNRRITPLEEELTELWYLLPEETRIQISKTTTPILPIKRQLVRDVFGDDNIDMLTKVADMSAPSTDSAKALKGKTLEISRIASKLYKGIVSRAKQNIVMFNKAVVTGNIVANTGMLVSRGVPPHRAITAQAEATENVIEWHSTKKQIQKLSTKLNTGRASYSDKQINRLEAKISNLENSLSNNPVHQLVSKHYLYDSVVEDLDNQTDIFEVIGEVRDRYVNTRVVDAMDKIPDNVASNTKTALDVVTIGPKTKGAEVARSLVQYSDLVSRVVLYDHFKNTTDMTEAEISNKVVDAFINYNRPVHPTVRWMEDNGLLWFSKYLLGIQKVLVELLKKNMASTVAVGMAGKYMDFSNPMNEFATPDKIMNKFSLDNTGEAFNLNAVNLFD